MELSKLINGTPLHAMGAILNDIQLFRRWGGAERRVGRGQNIKRRDNDDSTQKISKRKSTPKKRDSTDIQKDTSLQVSPGPFHDLTPDTEITEVRSKNGEKKVKKVGLGGILEPVRKTSSAGVRYYSCPYDPCEETTVSIEGMRSHIKPVHALFSYRCTYCLFTTKNFDSLKKHEKGCKGNMIHIKLVNICTCLMSDLVPCIYRKFKLKSVFFFFLGVSVC